MIPLKLSIRNFLSYGPEIQTITFSPYRLICLSGKNGHGKSALLDAITWALWGQARKISGAPKPDLGLMRLGQTHMLVSLDFLFNGQQYRAKREFSLFPSNKQVITLDFGLWDEETRTHRPLTGKTTRETQSKIEKTLNLDFESFANSAFLRQGQANEFSKKSPKERKEILGAILGLNKYEALRTRALEKIKQATVHKAQLLALQEKQTHDLQQAEALTQERAQIAISLEAITEKEKKVAQEKKELENSEKDYLEEQKQQQFIQFQLSKAAEQKKELTEKLLLLSNKWREINKKLANAKSSIALELEKKEIATQLHQEQKKWQKQLELKQQILQFREKAQRIVQEMQTKQAAALNNQQISIDRTRLELQATQTTLIQLAQQNVAHSEDLARAQNDKEQLTKKITQLSTVLERQEHSTKQFEKRKEYYQKYIAQGNMLKEELTNLAQKKHLAHDEENPSCPLCEQNLSAARKRFLKQKFEEQEHFLTTRIGRLSKLIKQLKQLLIEQHQAIQKMQITAQEHAATSSQLTQLAITTEQLIQKKNDLEKEILNVRKQEQAQTEHLNNKQKEFVTLEQQGKKEFLSNQEFIMLKQLLEETEKEYAQAGYCEKRYTALVEQLQKTEEKLRELADIEKEHTKQADRKQEVAQLCALLKKHKLLIKDLENRLKTFEQLTEKEKTIADKKQNLEQTQRQMTAQKEKLAHDKGRLESQLESLERTKKEQAENQHLVMQTEKIIETYQTIAQAISKDGIQALLIEEAIPEVEQEANNILEKLTNNQAHISIESLKDLKKGGTRETLDINISDTTGIRAYELFSGGEAFRIDFALRIAISKLLARRAGTSLQTLIIDEGFGSQDEEGLSLIMNALYAIQEDFSKIIIVSHLYSMKDQFPVHMVVEKGPNGSRVHVLEQG